MRPALTPPATMAAALAATMLAACGGPNQSGGVERKSAAGEVLGGETSDAMLPLDSVKSTSPAEPRKPADPRAGDGTEGRGPLPRPQVSGGPEPLPSDIPEDDASSPPQPTQ